MPSLVLIAIIVLLLTANVVSILAFLTASTTLRVLRSEQLAAERDTQMLENVSRALGQLVPPPIRKLT